MSNYQFKQKNVVLFVLLYLILSDLLVAMPKDMITIAITPYYFFAYNDKGKVLWKNKFTEQIKFADHWYNDDYLIGKMKNTIHVFKSKTGRKLWTKSLHYRIQDCTITGDTIVISTVKNILCFNANNGNLLDIKEPSGEVDIKHLYGDCNVYTYNYDYFENTDPEIFIEIVTTPNSICGFDVYANRIYRVPVKQAFYKMQTGGAKKENNFSILYYNKNFGLIVIYTYTGKIAWKREFRSKIESIHHKGSLWGDHKLIVRLQNGNEYEFEVKSGKITNKKLK